MRHGHVHAVCSAVQLIITCPVSNMEASNRMDTVFKDWYEVFASSSLYHLHPDWQMHVMKLHEYWPQLLRLIDREQLRTCFFDEIADINEIAERHPSVESHLPLNYNFEEAFEKVSNEWKTELMITVADKVLKWFDDDIPEKAVVTVVNGRIQVDCKQCPLYSNFCRDVMVESL